jgi:hypothetical protein
MKFCQASEIAGPLLYRFGRHAAVYRPRQVIHYTSTMVTYVGIPTMASNQLEEQFREALIPQISAIGKARAHCQ